MSYTVGLSEGDADGEAEPAACSSLRSAWKLGAETFQTPLSSTA